MPRAFLRRFFQFDLMNLRKVFCALAVLLTFMAAVGANPSKQIISHLFDEGLVAFVKPRKMPKSTGSTAVKPLVYDITMNTLSDSVSVTCTVVTPLAPLEGDSARVNGTRAYETERIYVTPVKKNWENRVRFSMPVADFEQTFGASDSDLNISFGGSGFLLPAKKQKNEAEVCRMLINMINLNRK